MTVHTYIHFMRMYDYARLNLVSGQSYNFRHSGIEFMLVLIGCRKMAVIIFLLVLFFDV